MADSDTETPGHETTSGGHAERSGGLGLSKKWHHVPVWGWVLGGTVAAVVAIKWWRSRSSSSAGSSSTGSSSVENCYDISGVLVPCAQAAANNASGAGDLGGTLGGIYTGSSSTGTGTGTSSTGSSSTGTTPPSSGRLSPPLGLHTTVEGKTGVRVNWIAVPGATGYVALCKQGGDNGQVVNGPFNTPATQTFANFGGLKAGTKYTALVWPSSNTVQGGPGSGQPHAEYSFNTSK